MFIKVIQTSVICLLLSPVGLTAQRDTSSGIRRIPIETASGDFEVWTRTVGSNPSVKVLLLHGGPGSTAELYEPFDDYLPQEGIEYIYYDQLGSYRSDQPADTSLWTIERFVDEVDQVRLALGLDSTNFVLLGQSWGGILGMEYALAHPEALKGLVISNMMSDVPAYNRYVADTLAPQLADSVLRELTAIEEAGDFADPRYMELLERDYYPKHVINLRGDTSWPDAALRGLTHTNVQVYTHMQGPSEFGIKGSATLANWSVTDRLDEIKVPTLVIAGGNDTMSPRYLEMMSRRLPQGSYLLNPEGGHLVQFDSRDTYYPGLISWLRSIE